MPELISVLLKVLVAHLVVDKCLCVPQDLVLPEPTPEPVPVSVQATDTNGVQLNISDSSTTGVSDVPQARPVPIQTQRNATDGSTSSTSNSSNGSNNSSSRDSNSNGSSVSGRNNSNINVPQHPLQMLIDALMQPQGSSQLMEGLLPRVPMSLLGEGNVNSFLHRIGVHALGRTELHMNQTGVEQLPLPPFVLVTLSTTPPSISSLANASITFSKGVPALTPFTLPPLQEVTPNSSLPVSSTESVEIFTSTESLEKLSVASTESLEKHLVASTESLERFTTIKPAFRASVSINRPKPSPKKLQGKKSFEKSSKRRNPTANDAVERRRAMIAKLEKKMDIATTTASSMPTTRPSNTLASPTSASITTVTFEPNKTTDSSKFKSNIIVSKADIIDAIVATSHKKTGSLESHTHSNTTLNPESRTPTSTNLDSTTSSLDIVSTTSLPTLTPSPAPIIETTSISSPVTISVKKSSTVIPVRSDLLDVRQLFRRIVHAAVKETTAAAAAGRGEGVGNIVSVRRRS